MTEHEHREGDTEGEYVEDREVATEGEYVGDRPVDPKGSYVEGENPNDEQAGEYTGSDLPESARESE